MIRLPSLRPIGTQTVLWDWVDDVQLSTHMQTRVYIGDYFEELTKQLYKDHRAYRYVTDTGADICPDVLIDDRTWLEVKSLGIGSNVIIYKDTMDRYLEFRGDRDIYFVFWRHTFRNSYASTLSEMYRKIGSKITHCLVVPIEKVQEVTDAVEPQDLMVRPAEHKLAWRLPKAATDPWFDGQQRLVYGLEVYGEPVEPVPVIDVDL